LYREEQDRENVLQYEDTERDASGQRIKLAFLVEHLDDDDGRGERAGHAQIKRVELAAAERQSDAAEEQDTEQAAADQLAAGSNQNHGGGANDLLEVDLEPDHEQHEDQAELGDDGDRLLGLDPARTEWTNHKPGDKVGQDQGLPEEVSGKAEHPGKQDA